MNITITTELVIGVLTVVGIVIYMLQRLGFLIFSKQKEQLPVIERRDCAKQCADHEKVVRDAALAVKESKMTSNKLAADITSLKEDVKDIKTTLEQREVNNQAEFRRIREMIGELSGYVKGLHDKDN